MGEPPSREQLERELNYYKAEYNELGARMLRLQEEQSRVAREARRSRIVARLVRDAYQIVNQDIAAEALGQPILATVADTAVCERAALLTEDPDMPGSFFVEHAFGQGIGSTVTLEPPPLFLYSAGGHDGGPDAVKLGELLGVPFVLWSYAPESGRALLLGNRTETNIHRPFDPNDRELVEVALAVYTDVLLRKLAETTLHQAKRTAEDSNNARARFLANLSHELRTPLNSIIGFSELLLQTGRRAPEPEQREEFTRQVLDAGRGLLSLAKDILDFSSLSNATPHLRIDWVPVSQLLYTAVRAFAAETAARGTRIELVPPTVGLQAAIDYDKFRQILANLLGNALKFTPSGGRVVISALVTDPGEVQISIQDTGTGIQPEDIARVLEPFVQLETPSRHNMQGAGLGLPIAKQLVEAHDGRLSIESVFGQGTTVTVTLPASSARLVHAPAAEEVK